jgi:hypothetical protein
MFSAQELYMLISPGAGTKLIVGGSLGAIAQVTVSNRGAFEFCRCG